MKVNPRMLVAIVIFLAYEVLLWVLTTRLTHGSEFWLFGSVLTALGLTALVVYLTVSALLGKQSRPKEEPETAGARPEKQSGAHFVIDMTPVMELIREANRRLAHSRTLNNKHGKTSLSDLPLYIMAGPAGAGKTTAFLASGLSPELLAGHVQRDATVLPTTHCNIWYASGAVFVEAGSQFFSDGAQGWKALLEQLRGGGKNLLQQTWQQSGQTNVRGLVLFCDVSNFVGGADSGKISALARKTQERMQVMGEVLGSSFPVYTVFSKADQIPHFDEFFYRLAEDESRQVLGCSISTTDAPTADEVYGEAQSKRLSEAFNRLYARLAEKRLRFLAREPEKSRRPGVYEFPRELKRVRDSLVQFLIESFRPNSLQPGPLLRGFYFTGMQQVAIAAAPSDVSAEVQTTSARNLEATVLFQPSLRVPEPAAAVPEKTGAVLRPRISFVADLFHKVILRDPLGRLAAVRNVRSDKKSRILAISVVSACCILAGCFAASWWGNLRLLTNVERAMPQASLPTAGNGSPAISDLKLMEQLRLALQPLLAYDRDGAPWRLRWGLYSGGRVLERTYDAYFQLFQRYFLNKTKNAFQSQLQALAPRKSATSYDSAYDTLKAYRMISGACPTNASFLAPTFFQSWSNGLSLAPEASQLADRQVKFYASELTRQNPYRIEEDAAAVANGRDYLAQFGGVDRLLRGLIADADQAPRKTVRVADLAPKFRQVLTGPGEMQAAFTLDGWRYVQQRLQDPGQLSLGEPCVLGSAAQSAARPNAPQSGQLKTLYGQTYIQAWKNFISSTSVQPFHSTAEAAKNLDILADNRSPLLAVLFLVSHNTSFATKVPAKQAKATDANAEIDRVFQPVHEVVNPDNQDRLIGDPNRDFMNALGELQQIMAQSQSRPPADPDPNLEQNAQQAVDKGLEAVRQIAQRFNITGSEGIDTEVRRLLESPFRSSMKLITIEATKAGNDKVTGAAKALCAKLGPLEERFPFNPRSDVDATSAQLSAIFAPQSGALSAFEQQLGKLIIFQTGHWIQNPETPQPRLTPQTLAWLDRLTAISEAFFTNGVPSPTMAYTATPLPIPGAESVTLEVDGQTLTTTTTQTQSKTLVWPGTPGDDGVLVRVKEGANIPFASYDGTWGIFRMLNDADPRPLGSHVIELSKVRRGHGRAESVLDANNKPIQVRLQLTGSPGRPDVFEKNFFQVHCPGKFLQ
ncbi:MAG TPA: type VI secretion system membrane subunit TssM [Bryobacteraceae bacterium]|nr:type VI secretion system membrane subunit TssM [Bryobacteraceae bacterium]